MSRFEPTPHSPLWIAGRRYDFIPHPLFPPEDGEVVSLEGGEAIIYQVREAASDILLALKVSKPSFRGPQVVESALALAPFATLPGLSLGNRLCLTGQSTPDTIEMYPDLEYAVLMPWVPGRTWAGLVADRIASAQYTVANALDLALATANALWNLEAHHLAHTDIAGGNIILSPDFKRVELLDIENLYFPNTPQPRWVSRGSPGYQHPRLGKEGNWRADGDRFAGAILLAEMIAWADPLVRAQTPEGAESLFQPDELQRLDVPRWQAVRDAIWDICPSCLRLFDQAWASGDLAECPELGAWALALIQSNLDSGQSA